MGVPVVRQFTEGGATGGLSGCSFCSVILKPVVLGNRTARAILHMLCSYACALLGAA